MPLFEDRGAVVAFGEPLLGARLAWSADSREIFAFTRRPSGAETPYTLRAYNPVAETRRVVGESPDFPMYVQASETGEWLYYVSSSFPSTDIFRVAQHGGSPERVTSGGGGLVVSGDDRYVASVPERHRVAVFDTRGQTRREFTVTDASEALAIAPDGSEIAVTSTLAGGAAIDILSTQTGTVRRVHTWVNTSPSSLVGLPAGASWQGGALHVLLMTRDQAGRTATFVERNVTTGAEAALGAVVSSSAPIGVVVSWAPAASVVAGLVAGPCIHFELYVGCVKVRYEMFVVTGGRSRQVGAANLPEDVGVALSPDARWVAVGARDADLSVKQLVP